MLRSKMVLLVSIYFYNLCLDRTLYLKQITLSGQTHTLSRRTLHWNTTFLFGTGPYLEETILWDNPPFGRNYSIHSFES